MPRLLLFIVGVGAGNTTRNLALLDELRRLRPDLDIHVAAQGRAAELLAEHVPVHPLREVTYAPSGSMSFWNIFASNLSFPVRFAQNRAAARRLLEHLRPDLAMADSDFYCLGPAKRMRVRLASLNNSPVIVAALRRQGTPPGCLFSARFIERTDSWLQHRFPDRVICPVLRPEQGLPAKFVQIPPIVRPEAQPGDEESGEIVVVTGGSGLGTDEIDLSTAAAPVVTYGTPLARVPPSARQMGFTLGALEAMRRARVLVVQGGFSSVSEAVALRRPAVVVPIRGHAEQHINARTFEELGLGLAASGPQAGARVNEALARHAEFTGRCRAHQIPVTGAAAAAKALIEML